MIDAICHMVFLVAACLGGSQTRLRATRCFRRVNIRLITRRLGEATPEQVAALKAALRLTVKYAIELDCYDGPKPVIHPLACPSRQDVEDWMRWAPAYLQATDHRLSHSDLAK